MREPDLLNEAIERAENHLQHHAVEGSDPGLCVANEFGPSLDRLVDFGLRCTRTVSTQRQALQAAKKVHLSGHGGTNDGIIGAAAAVKLLIDTAYLFPSRLRRRIMPVGRYFNRTPATLGPRREYCGNHGCFAYISGMPANHYRGHDSFSPEELTIGQKRICRHLHR